MSDDKRLVIFGCGGHARSVADTALSIGYKNLLFIDGNAGTNERIFGFPIVKSSLFTKEDVFIIAIGDNYLRCEIFKDNYEKEFIKLISPNAYIGFGATLGRGTVVSNGVHIGPLATIGENCIINTKSLIEHECVVGSHCHISVHSTIAGRCILGDFVFLGAGAVVRDGIKICSGVTIGSGSSVVKDITEPGVYVGCPVKKLR